MKERLILNHIIVIQNVFGPEAAGVLLFYKIDKDYWPALKSFMEFLNIIPEVEMMEIETDEQVWLKLKSI